MPLSNSPQQFPADACCGDNVEDELPFLLDASHIYKLSAAIVHEERLPKPQTEKLLRELDSMDAMIFNMFLLHRVLRWERHGAAAARACCVWVLSLPSWFARLRPLRWLALWHS